MTIRHTAAVFVLAAILGAGSTSCDDTLRGPQSVADTLYVGVAATPGSAAYFHGVELALARLNAERPKDARPLGLRMPPASEPSAVAVAARFRDDSKVIGVVGHTGSAETINAAPVYGDVENAGRDAVVAVTPTSTNPQVTRVNRWIFRVCPTDNDAARTLAGFAIDSLHARRVAIIYRNDLFGQGYTRTVAPVLAEAGVVITERDPYLAKITEYRAYAERIARSSVDAVIFAGGAADAAEMIAALHEQKAHPAILGSDDLANILGGAPTTAERDRFRDVRYTAFYDASREQSPEGRAFVEEYRKRWHETPTHQAALAYDAASLIGRATFAVGGDRHRVRDWIANVGRAAPPLPGITGEIAFDDHGDALDKPVLVARIAP